MLPLTNRAAVAGLVLEHGQSRQKYGDMKAEPEGAGGLVLLFLKFEQCTSGTFGRRCIWGPTCMDALYVADSCFCFGISCVNKQWRSYGRIAEIWRARGGIAFVPTIFFFSEWGARLNNLFKPNWGGEVCRPRGRPLNRSHIVMRSEARMENPSVPNGISARALTRQGTPRSLCIDATWRARRELGGAARIVGATAHGASPHLK